MGQVTSLMLEIQKQTLNRKRENKWCWKEDKTFSYTVKIA